jgi:hypothetical protein
VKQAGMNEREIGANGGNGQAKAHDGRKYFSADHSALSSGRSVFHTNVESSRTTFACSSRESAGVSL